jgi:hypothetical protein
MNNFNFGMILGGGPLFEIENQMKDYKEVAYLSNDLIWSIQIIYIPDDINTFNVYNWHLKDGVKLSDKAKKDGFYITHKCCQIMKIVPRS